MTCQGIVTSTTPAIVTSISTTQRKSTLLKHHWCKTTRKTPQIQTLTLTSMEHQTWHPLSKLLLSLPRDITTSCPLKSNPANARLSTKTRHHSLQMQMMTTLTSAWMQIVVLVSSLLNAFSTTSKSSMTDCGISLRTPMDTGNSFLCSSWRGKLSGHKSRSMKSWVL